MRIGNIIIIVFLFWFLSKLLERGETSVKIPPAFNDFINYIETKLGFTVKVVSGHRTYSEQARLHKQDPRNAPAGSSDHEIDEAIDIQLYRNGKLVLSKSSPKKLWLNTGIPQIAQKKFNIYWGGDFKNYADNNHFYFV